MNFKLGFGPMSPAIIDALLYYANEHQQPLMIIASRNQVDVDSGYVMSTSKLNQQVSAKKSKYIKVCRDHCGPYFLDSEKSLSIETAIEATKKTIAADIEQNFDLIHIDTSRCPNGYNVAEELIKFSLDLNPNIEFEFGTEENVGVAAGVSKYQQDVEFAKQFPNMKFVVAQTGSLVMEDRQVGTFDYDIVRSLVNYAQEAGVGLKEHNADYLTADQIALRKSAGVHALNIAPQLGVIETGVILELAHRLNINSTQFKNAVLSSNKWKKWHIDCDDDAKVRIAGHYLFGDKTFYDLTCKLPDWEKHVRSAIYSTLDLYCTNF